VRDPSFGEECDAGRQNSDVLPDTCRTTCLSPWCGDGVTDVGEECDDGNDVEDDRCSIDCKSPVCGDGLKEGDERCDDGNTVNGDGCSSLCREEWGVSPVLLIAPLLLCLSMLGFLWWKGKLF